METVIELWPTNQHKMARIYARLTGSLVHGMPCASFLESELDRESRDLLRANGWKLRFYEGIVLVAYSKHPNAWLDGESSQGRYQISKRSRMKHTKKMLKSTNAQNDEIISGEEL
jgi:hypothetical protein